jgi:hypothetical protein
MPVRGLRVQKYTQNMVIFGDVDQAEAHFLAPYYQFKLQVSDLTLFSIQDVPLKTSV